MAASVTAAPVRVTVNGTPRGGQQPSVVVVLSPSLAAMAAEAASFVEALTGHKAAVVCDMDGYTTVTVSRRRTGA